MKLSACKCEGRARQHDYVFERDPSCRVSCTDCPASTAWYPTPTEAAAAWERLQATGGEADVAELADSLNDISHMDFMPYAYRGVLRASAKALSSRPADGAQDPVAWITTKGDQQRVVLAKFMSADEAANGSNGWTARPLVYGDTPPPAPQGDVAEAVAKERERLAAILEAYALSIGKRQIAGRVHVAIAARIVRRGRELSATEKLANLKSALDEADAEEGSEE